ncbi:hypothetical protein ABT324_09680 [Saccharopolyspora sp. NPDC000359]|uniref:hypothetical protein n=1 Tax=Saccharopolyspora sp. NPDC000359 TaxID=3154251 RepID=UPI0033334438
MSAKLVRIGGIAAFVLGASFSLTPLAAGAAPGQAPPPVFAVDQDQDPDQDTDQGEDGTQGHGQDHGQCSSGDHNCKPKPPQHCKPHECPPPPVCKPGECDVAPPPAVAPPPIAPPIAPPPAVAPPPAAPPQQAPEQQPEQQPTVSPTQARPTQAPTAKPQAPMPVQQPQVEQKPVGGVQAGGGAMAQEQTDSSGPLVAVGGLALTALAAGGAYLHRRRHAEQRN